MAASRTDINTMSDLPKIIQGGMGVAISSWRLANAVSQTGHLGVISGTGIGLILAGRLADGDLDGSVRRALAHFPYPEPVERLLKTYYVEGGKKAETPYKRPPMWTTRPSKALNELTVIANFVEVFLAKEGHDNPVGINLLEKVQMPNMASLYGAMLAGVEYVIMGAGIPIQIPGILDQLADHQAVSYRLDVLNAADQDDYRLHFDPEKVFPGIAAKLGKLDRPRFLPIVSSVVLAMALQKRASGEINGFVIETPIAGGHNAPPRGPLKLNAQGEPLYGEKDIVNTEQIKKLGLPFWLAGGYGDPEMLQDALAQGAAGIQVGTAFAYCDESGLEAEARQAIIQKVLRGEALIHTSPIASPTGFPFKVVELEGTMSDADVYAARTRICDIGYLRHLVKNDKGALIYRCPAEPVDQYVKKGGLAEDTEGRVCLCNNLGAAAGPAQVRKDGVFEPMVITSGDDLVNIGKFVKAGATSYSARDVINYLMLTVPDA